MKLYFSYYQKNFGDQSRKMSYTIKNVENFLAFIQEQVDNGATVSDAFENYKNSLPKIPEEGEGVVIILNYGPKSHAVFGFDTKAVKDGLMGLNTEGKKDVISFNGKLEFGAGWVITNKTKLASVIKFLDKNEIAHKEIERDAFLTGDGTTAEEAPVKDEDAEDNQECDYASMTLQQLKTLAKEAGLASTGTKVELIEKLNKKGKESEEEKEESDEEPEEDEGKTLSKMKIEDLKNLLRERSLSTTGAKDVLITRILSSRNGTGGTPARSTKGKTAPKEKEAPKSKTVAKGKTAPKEKAVPKSKTVAKGKVAKEKEATKAVPKGKAQPGSKLIAKKNDKGNYVDEETGIAFAEVPIGTGGKKVKIAIGVQNPDSEETGIESLLPLDEDMISECETRKLQYLKEEMMETIEKKDPDLHEQLLALQSRVE
jgi:hypothetical protein